MSSQQPSRSVQSTKMERHERDLETPRTVILSLMLILILGLSVGLILSIWPETTHGLWLGTLSVELRYLILVACGGALGSTVDSLMSLINLIEKNRFSKGWGGQYLLKAVIAVLLAMAIYVIIRGGLLTPGPDSISYLNPYGLLTVSVLVGMLASPIIEKLGAVAQALSGQESKLETQIDRIGTALGVATLDNYHGFICLGFQDEKGEIADWGDDEILPIRAGRLYELVVWFQPNKPERVPTEEIRVTGGIDARTVEFQLIPDSDSSISIQPRQNAVSFGVLDRSPQVLFQFRAPRTAGPRELWVEVSQKNRLIHVIATTLRKCLKSHVLAKLRTINRIMAM